VLARPGVFLNTTGDLNLLPKVLDAANRFEWEALEQLPTSPQDYLAAIDFIPLFV
jgi:hypothetical protein